MASPCPSLLVLSRLRPAGTRGGAAGVRRVLCVPGPSAPDLVAGLALRPRELSPPAFQGSSGGSGVELYVRRGPVGRSRPGVRSDGSEAVGVPVCAGAPELYVRPTARKAGIPPVAAPGRAAPGPRFMRTRGLSPRRVGGVWGVRGVELYVGLAAAKGSPPIAGPELPG